MLGFLLSNWGRTGEALAMHRWAAELSVGADDMFGEYHVRSNIADLLTCTDRRGAEEECRQVLELTRRLGNRSGEAFAQVNLAHLLLLYGRWSEMEECARTALSLPSEPATHLWARSRLMVLHLLQGERAEALAEGELTAALAEAEDMQSRPIGGAALGLVQMLGGDEAGGLETAQEWAHRALETNGPCSDVARTVWLLASEMAVASDRDDVLGDLIDLVASRPPGHIPPFLRAETLRLQAGLAQRSGAPLDSAETDLNSALHTMEELGYPYWRALAELDLGRFLAGDDRADEAEKPLLSAAETFEELGARPALDRTRTLLGSLPS
jgi:tetratricopeptide (TPR) repeat protein